MWNRVVGQIGQAWNQGFQGAEGSDEAGVSSTQDSSGEVIESDLSSEQYLQIISSKQVELSSLRAKYETIYNKCKTLQSSYETDILAERSVIEALKVEIQARDKEQTENDAKAEAKFNRLKQQARARIQELSKGIDVIKRGQEGDGSSTAANTLEFKVDDMFGASPSSSRTGTPDRLQQEAYEKERELEELKRENTGLQGEKSELETTLSQLEEQLSQLQPIKNELKTSLASYNTVEQENAQLHSSIQEAAVKNSLLESRINEVIEERKDCEDNLVLFKKSKLNEFQEVIRSKSEEIEALNNSLSLLRLEYGGERAGREQLGTQVTSLKEEKELSRQRYQQLVLQVEGYTREIEQLRSAPGTESSEDACTQSNSETVICKLEGEVNELKSKLQDSDREVEQNRVDILSKDSELRRLEANLEEFQRRNEETSEEMRQNTFVLNTKTAESDRLTALQSEQAELISELRRTLEETAAQVSHHQAELRTAAQELIGQEAVCREMKEAVSKTLVSEEESRTLSTELRGKADKSEREIEGLRSQLQNVLRELKERNEDYAEIEGRFGKAEARLRDLDIDDSKMVSSGDLCRQFEEQNNVLSLEIEKVSKELASMTQSNSSLSKVKQNLEEGLSIFQSQTETQKSQIEELTNSNEKLLSEKTDIEEELHSISTQLEESTLQSRTLSLESSALKEETELLKEENCASVNQRESLEAELEQFSEQLHDKVSENGRLTSDMKELERNVSEREEKISSLEVELEILSGKVSGVQDTEQALLVTEQERSSHAQRVSLLEAELRGREGERVELELLRETGASSQQLRGIHEELQQKVSDRDLALEKLSTENKQIKDALDKSAQSVNQMRMNLDSANRDNNKLINDVGKISREKAQLASDLSTFEDELSRLRNQLRVNESEMNSLLKTTETTSAEMSLLHSNLSARDEECRHLKGKNALLGDDAKRMQEGFDSALELMQDKLRKSETRRSELESVREESELAAAHTREERARAETLTVELQKNLKQLEELQAKQLKLQSENQRLMALTAEHSSRLESSRCEADSLQEENVALRAAQENSFSGAQDQEVRSLQLSQEMALMSRENEQRARKLNEVSKLLEVTEFERDQLKEENTNVRDYTTQLQSLQIQFQQMTFERNALKERFEALARERDNLLQENSHLQSLQSSRQDAPSPVQTEVPAATSYYVTQLEERLQNVGYAHAKDLQRLSDMLEVEKHKSSQMEEAMRTSRPSDGLPLPATSISEDFSCLSQPTLDECLKVLKHQLTRWKNNPKYELKYDK